MSAGETMCYCYAVARPFQADLLDDVSGVRGAPVRLLEQGGMAALVSTVPAGEFDADALRASMEHLDWLESVARAHNNVVDASARHSTTLPFRLATIYLDEDRVRSTLRERAEELSAALARVSGRVEWGVKVYAQPGRAGDEQSSGTAEPAGERPGRAYLRKRITERKAGEQAWAAAVDAARGVDEALSGLAEYRRQHRPQSPQLSTVPGENVLNAAYLVAEHDSTQFVELVDAQRAGWPSCRIDVTGPWAPYSFALGDAPDDAAAERPEGPR